jgi:hypothetical protein
VIALPFPSSGCLLASQFWLSTDMPQYIIFQGKENVLTEDK